MREQQGDWWCPTCKQALSGQRVTSAERCDTCGTPVCVAGTDQEAERTWLREENATLRAEVEALSQCPTCDGTGIMDGVVGITIPDGAEITEPATCAECEGTGKNHHAELHARVAALEGACQAAKEYLKDDLVEPGRTVFWKLVHALPPQEAKHA